EGALTEPGVLDGAEDDRAGGDAGAAVVAAEDAAEGNQPVLACRVRLGEREPDSAGDRGDVDDPAVAALEHRGKQQPSQRYRRGQVDADDPLDLICVDRVE